MSKQNISARELFKNDQIPEQITVPVNENPGPMVPPVDEDYEFSTSLLRVLLPWIMAASAEWPLWLVGEKGVGKSSLPRQIAARLGIPVYSMSGNGRMELDELFGSKDLIDGDTLFSYGPLAEAYKYGGWFILDEADLIEPDILTGLNGVMEHQAITLPNGEVIQPNPDFKFILTTNTNGGGDESGNYAGAKIQNAAFRERPWMVQVDHAPRHVEEKILRKRFPDLPDETLDKVLNVAERVREQAASDGASPLETSMSTRVLKKWVEAMQLLAGVVNEGKSPALYALDICLGNGCQPETRQALRDIAKMELGDD
ncbi:MULTISPECIES: AAA family ATPase [unclassified Thioalkalivibrio]|uniref:AAA family ATPase n=1 Tax=unclassified Thioalkalivibrio TaxID=2621013 RepID=UPI000382A217|nr:MULTISPECIES: AAA family ATPase [unclassified Thioalkalivibrio]